MEKKGIYYNVQLFKWYFQTKKNPLLDSEKDQIFNLMSNAALEDIYIFTRFLLYIANTRKTDVEEIFYKIICHFLGTMWPDFIMANIHHFIRMGKKDDILYFVQIPSMTAKARKWIEHIAKYDADFKILLQGEMIGKPIDRQVYYKPKLKLKQHTWQPFLFKLLDDPIYNGIVAGDLDSSSYEFNKANINIDDSTISVSNVVDDVENEHLD